MGAGAAGELVGEAVGSGGVQVAQEELACERARVLESAEPLVYFEHVVADPERTAGLDARLRMAANEPRRDVDVALRDDDGPLPALPILGLVGAQDQLAPEAPQRADGLAVVNHEPSRAFGSNFLVARPEGEAEVEPWQFDAEGRLVLAQQQVQEPRPFDG